MLTLKKVAVTGGLSCGKSSVCRVFKELGAQVVSADEIVHQLLTPETQLGQEVVRLLDRDVVREGKIDRTVVAKKVFNNHLLLQSLQHIIHPVVFREIDNLYQQVKRHKQTKLFVAEVPLLFEAGGAEYFDTTIAVIAPPDQCMFRFRKTSRDTDEEYYKRMANQLSSEEKARRADYIIDNSGSVKELNQAVKSLFKTLIT